MYRKIILVPLLTMAAVPAMAEAMKGGLHFSRGFIILLSLIAFLIAAVIVLAISGVVYGLFTAITRRRGHFGAVYGGGIAGTFFTAVIGSNFLGTDIFIPVIISGLLVSAFLGSAIGFLVSMKRRERNDLNV